MKKPRQILSTLSLVGALFLNSCAGNPNTRAAHRTGAVAGGGVGAILGNNIAGIAQGEAIIAGAILGALFSERSRTRPVPTIRTKVPGRTYR